MIGAFEKYIAVKETQIQEMGLIIGDSVGLAKVTVVSIPKRIRESIGWTNDYKLKEGSKVYIKTRSEKYPYISIDKEKIIFVEVDDIVAADLDTVEKHEYCLQAPEPRNLHHRRRNGGEGLDLPQGLEGSSMCRCHPHGL